MNEIVPTAASVANIRDLRRFLDWLREAWSHDPEMGHSVDDQIRQRVLEMGEPDVTTYSAALRAILRPTQMRLIEILAASRGPVSGREFARRLEISPTSAIAALKRLEKAGIVIREEAGKAHLWRLDETDQIVRGWLAERSAARHDRLLGLIQRHSGTRYLKILNCAQDVWAEIRLTAPPAQPRLPWDFDLHSLTAIEVHVAEHYDPGRWKMTRHDHCQVIGGETREQAILVTHDDCTVLGESEDL
jgi:DNA-binding transcriptional ArsR family regulator